MTEAVVGDYRPDKLHSVVGFVRSQHIHHIELEAAVAVVAVVALVAAAVVAVVAGVEVHFHQRFCSLLMPYRQQELSNILSSLLQSSSCKPEINIHHMFIRKNCSVFFSFIELKI